ncbi:hypothetical protein [Tersicoccus phoenicis]|uniref:hypothetical protein n=1 Tax=Tersicoccus phoenicis TaxID=554083 RepID=UPI0013967390|nr:hypothetical protein [Tersicoccus phoenicis]
MDRTTVDRRRKAHQLYAVTTPIGLRYPAWLQEVIEPIPADVHPLTVEALMTEPAEETDGRSPLSWLASGGPAALVVALVRELAWLP